MDCTIDQEKGNPFTQFNIFDYVDQSKFIEYPAKKQMAIQKFLRAFVELRKVCKDERWWGCPVCGTSTKNMLCRYCISDFFGSCRPLTGSSEYDDGRWKKIERY